MGKSRSFNFLDGDLNRQFFGLLKRADIEHSIDKDGLVHFSEIDEDAVENELIRAIRARVFPSWQILTCPDDWTERYLEYMRAHQIPFKEESSDGELWFLLPRKYRPHSWKLDGTAKKRVRKSVADLCRK